MRTVLKGARVILPDCVRETCVAVRDGQIEQVADHIESLPGERVIDAAGYTLCPGFVDLHVHGGGGHSAMSGKAEDICAMAEAHALCGTTSMLPTTLAAPPEQLETSVRAIRRASTLPCKASILGAHLEGPFLNPLQAGAQAPGSLSLPNEEILLRLLDAWPGGIRMMGAAPEMEGGMELGRMLVSRGITASIAHSDATYDDVLCAIQNGYSDVTHLYSSCSGLKRVHSYRIPGVIEAGLNLDALTVQVIADGKHLPLSLLQLIMRCKGPDRIELITDGLEFAASELEEGTVYRQFNGVETVYEDGVMKLLSRESFAGSVATLLRCVRTMVSAGISLADAVRMASQNPARRIGADKKGRIASGMDADLLLLDAALDLRFVMSRGQVLRDGRGEV